MAIYLIANGPMPTTAAFALVQTGTSIKTMMQVVPQATVAMKITEWGISFNASAAAAGVKVELIETDVGATITQYAATAINKLDAIALAGGDPTTALFDVSSTTKSGYTASAEGTITAIRNLDGPQFVPPTGGWSKQFPLDDEPVIQPAKFARIRVTSGADYGCYCWMKVKV